MQKKGIGKDENCVGNRSVFSANNGMTISARRFCETLRAHGHTVRVVSTGQPGDTEYLMKKQYIPVFDRLISAQGMTFAKTDPSLLRKALAWADVVHFLTPFALTHNGIQLCREMGVPYTAAFHVQPENITSSVHLGKIQAVNRLIYHWFRWYIYRWCAYVHCPSRFIAGELERHGYPCRLCVISNGIDPDFTYRKLPHPPGMEGRFLLLSVGRLSIEKRQDVILRAVALSRYKAQIVVRLAGQGPRRRSLEALAKKCGVAVEFGFYGKSELLDLIASSDLYVHAADAEIEAMSCMEAFAGGLVPVIADSKKSATPQFALDDRSLFTAGDPAALAKKSIIGSSIPANGGKWNFPTPNWVKNTTWTAASGKRRRCSPAPWPSAGKGGLWMKRSGRTLEKDRFSEEAIRSDFPDAADLHPVHFPQTQAFSVGAAYDFARAGWGQRLGYRAIRCFAHFVLPFYTRTVLGLRVRGLSNLSQTGREGLVVVCNHTHYLDCALIDCLFQPLGRRMYYATLENNFKIPMVRHLIRWLGGVPIPRSPHRMARFFKEMDAVLRQGHCVCIYPEGILHPYADRLYPIKRGAFHLAVQAGVPLLPLCVTFRESAGPRRLLRQKPLIDLHILEPMQADPSRPRREEIERLMAAYRRSVQTCMEEAYGEVPDRPAEKTV